MNLVRAFILLTCIFSVAACGNSESNEQPPTAPKTVEKSKPVQKRLPPRDPADTLDTEKRISGEVQGNYIWSAAPSLLWRELMDSVVYGKVEMEGLNERGKHFVESLNQTKFSARDLDEASRYVKCGFGQPVLDEIRQEVTKRFPGQKTSFPETIEPTYLVAYALINKKMKYLAPFGKSPMKFQNKEVLGFGASGIFLEERLIIWDYTDDDHFILELITKDRMDGVFLAKGYAMQNPQTVLKALHAAKRKAEQFGPGHEDRFWAPNLDLDYQRSYSELEDHFFDNTDLRQHKLLVFNEQVKFHMDESGVEATSAAEMYATDSAGKYHPPMNLFLDKPYWVILQRKDAPRPYFLLGVRNDRLMEPHRKTIE